VICIPQGYVLNHHVIGFGQACLSFLDERHFMLDEANGVVEHSETQESDISASIMKVSLQDEFSSMASKLFPACYSLCRVFCS